MWSNTEGISSTGHFNMLFILAIEGSISLPAFFLFFQDLEESLQFMHSVSYFPLALSYWQDPGGILPAHLLLTATFSFRNQPHYVGLV